MTWRRAGTDHECKDESADSVADVGRDVVGKLLNGRQESLQLVELSLNGARVAAATRRRRRCRRDGGAAARRPRLAARGAR